MACQQPRYRDSHSMATHIHLHSLAKLRSSRIEHMSGILNHLVGLLADGTADQLASRVCRQLGSEKDKSIGFDRL